MGKICAIDGAYAYIQPLHVSLGYLAVKLTFFKKKKTLITKPKYIQGTYKEPNLIIVS